MSRVLKRKKRLLNSHIFTSTFYIHASSTQDILETLRPLTLAFVAYATYVDMWAHDHMVVVVSEMF